MELGLAWLKLDHLADQSTIISSKAKMHNRMTEKEKNLGLATVQTKFRPN